MRTGRSKGVGRLAVQPWAAWGAVLVVVMAFAATRSAISSRPALVFSQVVFLVPTWLAFGTTAWAWRVTTGARDRLAWLFLAATMALLSLSETFYSFLLLNGGIGPAAAEWAPEILNVVALFTILAYLAVVSGIDLLPVNTTVRVGFDVMCLLALAYVGLYRFWIKGLIGDSSLGWEPYRWTFYALVGVLVAGLDVGAVLTRPAAVRRPVDLDVAWALGIYCTGLVLWPVWHLAAVSDTTSFQEVASGVMYLIGYCMLGIAGLRQAVTPGRQWSRGFDEDDRLGWLSQLVGTAALLSVPLVGSAALAAEGGSAERLVYLGATSIATVAVVSRTTIAGNEAAEVRRQALTDPVTGAYNSRSMRERCDDFIVRANRADTPFALAIIDIDDFSLVNVHGGTDVGDRVLAAVAGALGDVVGGPEAVFRMSGDEFAVLLWGCGIQDAAARGQLLREAIGAVPVVRGRLGASVGIAVWPVHARDREQLVTRADGAQAWAKYHGKNRVVVFDERIVRALGIDERLALHEESARMELANALLAAADARDPASHAHSRSVAALALLLGEADGMDAEELRRLEVASMLHDVGKIALPEHLLSKRMLTPRAQRELESHAALGERLVASVGYEDVPLWVRSHHERWDGSGFPDGLRGEDIPRAARIIALADAYDMMTRSGAGSPYSKAAALQEIDHGMGSRFDPELAELFIQVVADTEALGWSDGSVA